MMVLWPCIVITFLLWRVNPEIEARSERGDKAAMRLYPLFPEKLFFLLTLISLRIPWVVSSKIA